MGIFGQKDPAKLLHRGKKHYQKMEYIKAVDCYKQAAGSGYAEAQRELGQVYREGIIGGLIVEEDSVKAAYWYEKAAQQGDLESQLILGVMYFTGEGVDTDFVKAAQWFERAAAQGDDQGYFYLGRMYRNGYGMERNIKKALYWLEKAAERENGEAQNELGDMYRSGDGVERDSEEALYWFEEAINSDCGIAAYNLATMYYHGEGLDRDFSEALKLLDMIDIEYEPGEENNTFADIQYYKSLIYMDGGYGVKKDDTAAIKSACKATDQGRAEAVRVLKEYEKRGLIKRYTKLDKETLEKEIDSTDVIPFIIKNETYLGKDVQIEVVEIIELFGKKYLIGIPPKSWGDGDNLTAMLYDENVGFRSIRPIEDFQEHIIADTAYKGLLYADKN